MSIQLQKYIDWVFIPDANRRIRDCDTIIMVSSQVYIPMYHWIYEMVKHLCDTINMLMSQIQIPLRHLTLRKSIIYNHWLVN